MDTKNIAAVCLDATGSMRGQRERVVTSMNEYAESVPEDTHLVVFMFNTDMWAKHYDGEARQFPKMTLEDYKPYAMTPLYDSVAKTIEHVKSIASENDKVMVMVDTDGEENASTDHTQETIKALVDAQKAAGWDFLFMANGLDQKAAQHVADSAKFMGMASNVAHHGLRSASYKAASLSTQAYFKSGKKAEDWKPDVDVAVDVAVGVTAPHPDPKPGKPANSPFNPKSPLTRPFSPKSPGNGPFSPKAPANGGRSRTETPQERNERRGKIPSRV